MERRARIARFRAERIARCTRGLPVASRTWQQQLAHEREELSEPASNSNAIKPSRKKTTPNHPPDAQRKLHAAREKITALNDALLRSHRRASHARQSPGRVVTELELSRARERELKAAIDEQKRSIDDERTEWAEELSNSAKYSRDTSSEMPNASARQSSRPTPPPSTAANQPLRLVGTARCRARTRSGLDRRAVRQAASTTGRRAASPHQAR